MISESQIRELIEKAAPYTTWVRTWGSTNGLEHVGRIAHEYGLKAAVGAWLSSDLAVNEVQINSLIAIGQAGEADLLIVGSEVLLRHDLTENQLIEYINRAQEAVPEIPVATSDTYAELLEHPAVINAGDVVLPNYYPYWEGKRIDLAAYFINLWHKQVVAKANGKPVIVSETGWPSAGPARGDAVPSEENAAFFFLNFVSWAKALNVDYFYFEAFDEPWKGEGGVGAHWGILTSDGSLKTGMERVFNCEIMDDNWSVKEIPCGPGEPSIKFTFVPKWGDWGDFLEGQVCHVDPADYRVACYIKVGSWWTKPYWNNPKTVIGPDGSWACNVTTGGIDEQATDFAAFLVRNDYSPPLCPQAGCSPLLPAELYTNAVTYAEIKRAHILDLYIIGQGNTIPSGGHGGYRYGYGVGESVTLTAIPHEYWQFSNWSGDLSGTQNPIAITMDSDKGIIANFALLPGYNELQIWHRGQGITDPPRGSHAYPEGTVVTVSARTDPNYPGWWFDQWEVDLTGTENPTTITVDSNKEVIAVFMRYCLTMSVVGKGKVVPEAGIHCYGEGDLTGLLAIPDPGWEFSQWSGDYTGNNPEGFVVMYSDKIITAHFVETPH